MACLSALTENEVENGWELQPRRLFSHELVKLVIRISTKITLTVNYLYLQVNMPETELSVQSSQHVL